MDFILTLACVAAFLYMLYRAGMRKKEKEIEAAGLKFQKGLFRSRSKTTPVPQLPAPASSPDRKTRTFCKVLIFFRDEETDSDVLRDKIDAKLACALNDLYDMDVYDFDIKLESFSDVLTIFIEYRRPAA